MTAPDGDTRERAEAAPAATATPATAASAATAATTRPRRWRTTSVLRWIHLLAGMLISYYFIFKPAGGWSNGFESFMGDILVPFVAWTGIARWQLPRYRRWRARRRVAS